MLMMNFMMLGTWCDRISRGAVVVQVRESECWPLGSLVRAEGEAATGGWGMLHLTDAKARRTRAMRLARCPPWKAREDGELVSRGA
jgi:hypothetical protein